MKAKQGAKTRRISLVIVGLALGLPMFALGQNYVFGPNVRVNDDSPGMAFHSTYSPGQHLIACRGDTVYLVWRDERATAHIYFARSSDAGQSFLPNVRVDNIPGCAGIMPSMAVDDSGRIHVCWLNYNPYDGRFVYYTKSTDGGQSFLPSVRACDSLHGNQYALPSIAVSRSGRFVYVARSEAWNDSYPASPYQVRVSRSTDGGATFITPDTKVNLDTADDMYDPSVAVFDDTIVFVAWTDSCIYAARSIDGGATFGPNIVVQESVGGIDEPSIGVDTTGRVFVVWNGINISTSADTGRTFSPRRRIPSANGQYPSLWVSADGRLYVTWEFWNGVDGMGYEVRLSFSTDGGATFSPPVNPSDGPLNNTEYAGTVAANPEGKVFMAWLDYRNDGAFNNDIYFATGILSGIEERPLTLPSGLNLSVQPSISRGIVSLLRDVPRLGCVSVSVFDFTGRKFASLHEGLARAGAVKLTWDGKNNSGRQAGTGVYFVSLVTPYGSLTRKVLLVSQ
jgi:hypothetical protein